MNKLARDQNRDIIASATGQDNFAIAAPLYDAFLIGPHITYKLNYFSSLIPDNKPIKVINGSDYITMNAEKILNDFIAGQTPVS
ncbi:PTS sugar transporter subunit IIB [Candidatus Sodalis pierantonius]|uniref:PTS sugar transporter subunit IIB n=1 Tax=Candidatus Sodalis pierantonii TaxID=1486991 RepID=UPI0009DF8007|nr:hypothetical protein [Candidatus Sodalis pierantonius]